MKLFRPVALTIAAVLAVPLALTTSPASAMIPEKDVLWDPTPYSGDYPSGPCFYDHASDPPFGYCDIPTDEPLLTQGTLLKATSTPAYFSWPAHGLGAEVITVQGHKQSIPASDVTVTQADIAARMPAALNWDVEQDLEGKTSVVGYGSGYDWPQVKVSTLDQNGNYTDFYMPMYFASVFVSPVSLTAKRLSTTSASISWSSAGDYPQDYVVTRHSSSGTWSTVVPNSTRSFTFTHLTPGMTYTLSVQARNLDNGVGTGVAGQVTAAGATTSLSAPSSVTAARTGQSSAKISWSAPTTLGGKKLTGYKVSRDGKDTYGGGAYSKVVSATTRSFTLNYLRLGDTYTLSVQAVYTGGTGPVATVPVFVG